ncbi:MAG: hypothetical protein WCH98_21625, partial [Verrucomicrobiota bacterium]
MFDRYGFAKAGRATPHHPGNRPKAHQTPINRPPTHKHGKRRFLLIPTHSTRFQPIPLATLSNIRHHQNS